jgi:long-chain acyl-CoA synthetase
MARQLQQRQPAVGPQTLVELFLYSVNTYGKRDALKAKRGGTYHSISAEELLNWVKQLAAALVGLGIDHGDRVALLSENRPEWTVSDLATLSIGAVNVPLYPTLPAPQIATQLADAGARAVIVSGESQRNKIETIRAQVPSLERVISFDGSIPVGSDWLLLEDLLRRGAEALKTDPSLFERKCKQVKPHDLASILYTSGTTGTPRGVMLSHSNIVSNALACSQVLHLDKSDVALSFLPLCHIFERTSCYLEIYRGVTIAFAENPETVPQNLIEVQPTIVTSVPRLFEKMYARIMETIETSSQAKKNLMRWALSVGRRHSQLDLSRKKIPLWLAFQYKLASILVFSKLQKKLGGRLRMFVSGGAPLDQSLAEFFSGVGILILEGYGLTETSPVIAVNTPTHLKLGTVGKPLPGVDVKIAADGEILTRGASVMVGYFKKEQESQTAMEGGWFHTGDLGELDQEGFLRITGRKKDMLITAGGKNVAPQKIEGLLSRNPYLQHVVVVGDRRPFIAALVVPSAPKILAYAGTQGLDCSNYSSLVRSPAIYEFLMEQIRQGTQDLAPFEQIKQIGVLEQEFSIRNGELTPKMNVRRHKIEANYKDLIDDLYARFTR